MVISNFAIMLVGLPASGKSTYAEKLAKHVNVEIISSDTIRAELTGDINNQDRNNEVFEIVYRRVEEALHEGKNIIVDSTALKVDYRKKFVEICKKFEVFCIVWEITSSVKTCLRRNTKRDRQVPEDIILQMAESYELPQLSEGFDMIVQNEWMIKIADIWLSKSYRDLQKLRRKNEAKIDSTDSSKV